MRFLLIYLSLFNISLVLANPCANFSGSYSFRKNIKKEGPEGELQKRVGLESLNIEKSIELNIVQEGCKKIEIESINRSIGEEKRLTYDKKIESRPINALTYSNPLLHLDGKTYSESFNFVHRLLDRHLVNSDNFIFRQFDSSQITSYLSENHLIINERYKVDRLNDSYSERDAHTLQLDFSFELGHLLLKITKIPNDKNIRFDDERDQKKLETLYFAFKKVKDINEIPVKSFTWTPENDFLNLMYGHFSLQKEIEVPKGNNALYVSNGKTYSSLKQIPRLNETSFCRVELNDAKTMSKIAPFQSKILKVYNWLSKNSLINSNESAPYLKEKIIDKSLYSYNRFHISLTSQYFDTFNCQKPGTADWTLEDINNLFLNLATLNAVSKDDSQIFKAFPAINEPEPLLTDVQKKIIYNLKKILRQTRSRNDAYFFSGRDPFLFDYKWKQNHNNEDWDEKSSRDESPSRFNKDQISSRVIVQYLMKVMNDMGIESPQKELFEDKLDQERAVEGLSPDSCTPSAIARAWEKALP